MFNHAGPRRRYSRAVAGGPVLAADATTASPLARRGPRVAVPDGPAWQAPPTYGVGGVLPKTIGGRWPRVESPFCDLTRGSASAKSRRGGPAEAGSRRDALRLIRDDVMSRCFGGDTGYSCRISLSWIELHGAEPEPAAAVSIRFGAVGIRGGMDQGDCGKQGPALLCAARTYARCRHADAVLSAEDVRSAGRGHPRLHHVDRERKDDGRAALAGDVE
jgi:hypothetical protein